MDIEDLNKLEDKVKNLVNNLEIIRKENNTLKERLNELRSESSVNNSEKDQIRKKVKSLIKLIESIENEN
ncbi:MAG: hypothetical protein KAS97_03815 [Candidatus Aminicenantes bacterium]|nr:hypothetical protein [Candidatus Aminicenantes bacterium]